MYFIEYILTYLYFVKALNFTCPMSSLNFSLWYIYRDLVDVYPLRVSVLFIVKAALNDEIVRLHKCNIPLAGRQAVSQAHALILYTRTHIYTEPIFSLIVKPGMCARYIFVSFMCICKGVVNDTNTHIDRLKYTFEHNKK